MGIRGASFVLALAAALSPAAALGGDGVPAPKGPPPRDLSPLLAPILGKHGIPGMAAAIVDGERLTALGVAGVREAGKPEQATTADCWHLGSCTKAMTATLCAMLVEDGKLRGEPTVGEAFKDLPRADREGKP